ncbi:MAG: hypothetical protein M5U34_32040 [Chloroflexi bacterium]|nr:hypothetical protein [Chloroflexota bacterium]
MVRPAKTFDGAAFVGAYGGFLLDYTEEVEGTVLTGPQIVQLIADRFSVNPRLLLAALEYSSGWVTKAHPEPFSEPGEGQTPSASSGTDHSLSPGLYRREHPVALLAVVPRRQPA